MLASCHRNAVAKSLPNWLSVITCMMKYPFTQCSGTSTNLHSTKQFEWNHQTMLCSDRPWSETNCVSFFLLLFFLFFHILMHIINYNYTFSYCDAKDSECDDVSWKVRVECEISNKGTFIANIDPCIQLICSNLLRFKICISSYLEYIFQLERTFQLESLSYIFSAW